MINWGPPILSKLTALIYYMGLTHLDSEASNFHDLNKIFSKIYEFKYHIIYKVNSVFH